METPKTTNKRESAAEKKGKIQDGNKSVEKIKRVSSRLLSKLEKVAENDETK